MKLLRSFILSVIIILVIVVVVIAGSGTLLAVFSPFHPGNLLFPIQSISEQELRLVYKTPERRSEYILDLLERRINDISFRTGSEHELKTLEYLEKSIDQAANSISLIPENKSNTSWIRFYLLIYRANQVIDQLRVVPIEDNVYFNSVQANLLAYIKAAQTNGILQENTNIAKEEKLTNTENIVPAESSITAPPGLIPFPPGSSGAEHGFYPLIGKHAKLNCDDCHDQGRYVGTPNTCIFCHFNKRPDLHFSGRCELCHTSVAWTDIQFDHITAKAENCISCHYLEKPAAHYPGQCSACHVIEAWNIVDFNHDVAQAVDCISCHSDKLPLNHYPGQCSNCHVTTDWASVSFDHTGFDDCVSCHSDLEPPNHYPGQCSNCHNTSNWTSVVFDHTGFSDCVSCHSGDSPANHYDGQCSRCHSTSTWQGAIFNHAGLTDCISCHAADAPGGHYQGQCSQCHDAGGNWANVNFNHAGFSDCVACHSGNAPSNHYPGQCSSCHSTDSWGGANFNHNGFPDCISCHLAVRPAEHDQGQCSECHNTQNWGDGGDSGGDGNNAIIITGGQFLGINCQACHFDVVASVQIESKQ